MRVKSLWEYPVKSLAGYSLQTATLTSRGFAHDRRWMLIDEDGVFISQRDFPHLSRKQAKLEGDTLVLTNLDEGAVLHIPDAGAGNGERITVQLWDDTFEARLVPTAGAGTLEAFFGFPCRMVYMAGDCRRQVDLRYASPGEEVGFADGFPYLIANQASADALAGRYGSEIDMLRFRPNIVVEGAPAFAEDHWTVLEAATGSFRTPKPCARCVVITIDPATGEKQPEVLAALAAMRTRERKVLFGVNACWMGTDMERISVGDKFLALTG